MLRRKRSCSVLLIKGNLLHLSNCARVENLCAVQDRMIDLVSII
jgi:hypothetical protein